MTDQHLDSVGLRERIARIVGSYVVYDDKGGPDTEVLADVIGGDYEEANRRVYEIADAILREIETLPPVGVGWKMVPVEPTEAMISGACAKHTPGQPMNPDPKSFGHHECPAFDRRRRIWADMIAASPQSPGEEKGMGHASEPHPPVIAPNRTPTIHEAIAELREAAQALLADSYPVGTGEDDGPRERLIAALAATEPRGHQLAGQWRLRPDHGGYVIERELSCINGLPAWFSLGRISGYEQDQAAVEMSDGAVITARDDLVRFLSGAPAPSNQNGGLSGATDNGSVEPLRNEPKTPSPTTPLGAEHLEREVAALVRTAAAKRLQVDRPLDDWLIGQIAALFALNLPVEPGQ